MRVLLFMIRKEFLQIRRDRRMLPILFLAPVIQLLILGYAANLDVREIPAVVCDMDRTAASRDFLAQFFHSGYFTWKRTADSPGEIDRFIENGKASAAFVIPRGFGERVKAGKTAQVQMVVDGAESQAAVIGLNYAAMIASGYSRRVVLDMFKRYSGPGLKPVEINPEIRVWYNPELRSRNFFVPGVLALLLMVMTLMLTSMGIVKEKEAGTMEQLIVTPIKPGELILGKLLPFVLIGLMDVVLIVCVARFWFKVPIKGNVPLLFGLSLIFMTTTLGLGLFTSTISRSQQQAMMTAVFFMMPMILLSGFIFPIENMPRIIQYFTYIIPLRYFFVIIRGLFLKGVGIGMLWDEALVLLAFGAVILALSALRFQKKLG
ncbi:MAG: ABC transporter permease [Candidatus Aminicenantales bacterium]